VVQAGALHAPEFELPAALPFEPGDSPFRVAGAVYRGLIAFVDAHVAGGFEAIRHDLAGPIADYLGKPPDLFSKYDAVPLPFVNQAVARRRRVGFEEQLRDSNTWSEMKNGALYRAVLAVLSAQSVALALPRAAAIAQHFGRTTTRVAGPRAVTGTREGVPRILVRWTGFASAYYLERALLRAGAREPSIEYEQPVADGELAGEPTYAIPFSVSWQS
jgi:hypothetical protein